MLLPRENSLDVLHCVDFTTLLALKRAGSPFYDVINLNEAILSRLRIVDFYLHLASGFHKLQESVEGDFSTVLSAPSVVPFDDEFVYAKLRRFAATVGTNFIDSAIIASSLGAMRSIEFDMRKAVEALQALKHVRKLTFDCRCLMRSNYAVDMDVLERLILSPLDNLQCLDLTDVNCRTDWAFLRKDWARRLRSLSVEAYDLYEGPGYREIGAPGQSEILRHCTDFARLERGKSKKLTITGWLISPEFLQRIVKTVSKCEDRLTVVIGGAPGFVGNDTDYTRFDVPHRDPRFSWSVGFVRYSARDFSHRIFVRNFDNKSTIAVTNNPFVKTWSDTYKWDIERL